MPQYLASRYASDMTKHYDQDLKPFLYPYSFVLTEGKEIQTNSLDYSLCMVQVGLAEKIPSPHADDQLPLTDLNSIFLNRR